ncbi:hypothetical protein EVAR_63678_1 [Eumeta japonica]|uniref:Uncharacterized protein n=1 Tax=Eumeta variegata TaxID=151549 RepID=A0A4C1ZTK4_EUMVA|nr:hypothetical protein EVAR_63678_1 [Eumeta japonica]
MKRVNRGDHLKKNDKRQTSIRAVEKQMVNGDHLLTIRCPWTPATPRQSSLRYWPFKKEHGIFLRTTLSEFVGIIGDYKSYKVLQCLAKNLYEAFDIKTPEQTGRGGWILYTVEDYSKRSTLTPKILVLQPRGKKAETGRAPGAARRPSQSHVEDTPNTYSILTGDERPSTTRPGDLSRCSHVVKVTTNEISFASPTESGVTRATRSTDCTRVILNFERGRRRRRAAASGGARGTRDGRRAASASAH